MVYLALVQLSVKYKPLKTLGLVRFKIQVQVLGTRFVHSGQKSLHCKIFSQPIQFICLFLMSKRVNPRFSKSTKKNLKLRIIIYTHFNCIHCNSMLYFTKILNKYVLCTKCVLYIIICIHITFKSNNSPFSYHINVANIPLTYIIKYLKPLRISHQRM